MPNLILIIFTWFDWRVIKTENYTIIYKPGYEYSAMQTLNILEYYRSKVNKLTGHTPKNLPVVIEDVGIISNGFANPFFYNIHIFSYPPNSHFYQEGIEDWFRLVCVHEYTHIAHTTKTSGIPKFLTTTFGAPFQSNMYSPGWIIEGITVYSESQSSPYEGRLNDGFFDNYLATRISEDKFPTIIEATNEPLSFPYGKIYLFGGEFFDFLANKYGEEKFAQFFRVYGSYPQALFSVIFPGLGIDIAAKRVYGKTFPGLFAEWKRYESGKQIDYQIVGERLTKKGWYVSSLVYHKNKIYYSRELPIKLDGFKYRVSTHIMGLDFANKKEQIFATLNSPLTARMKLYNDHLYFCNAEIRRAENVYYNGFGITSVLNRMNLNSKKFETLFKDDIRTFCVLNDSVILYTKTREKNFGSEIWLYTPEIRKKLWAGELLINDIESNKKWIVVSASKEFENTDLYILDLETLDFYPILQTPWTEGNLCFISEDTLGFIANYEGKHKVYGIDLNKPENIFCYTKAGFINSFVVNDSVIFFSNLNSKGFDIYKKITAPEIYELKAGKTYPKPDFNVQSLVIKRGDYFDIARTLVPTTRLPLFLPMDSTFKKWLYGGVLLGSDATNEHFYLTIMGYDQLNKTPYLQVNFQSLFFNPLNIALFYHYNDYLYLSSGYPLFYSGQKKMRMVWFNLKFKSFDGYKRKEITPGITLTGGRTNTNFFLNFSVPVERKIFKSSIDRTCFLGRVGLNNILFNGELRLQLTGFSDTQNPGRPSFLIRGYDAIYSKRGIIFNIEYAHRLLNIRRGLWNPNLYLEDLFGIIFFDCAIDENHNNYISTGFELTLEAKSGFGFIKFLPKIGIAFNKEKKIKMTFDINAPSLLFNH